MTESLRGPLLKVQRAQAQIQNLAGQVNVFIQSNPYAIVREADPAGGDDFIRAKLTRNVPEIIDVLIGETLFNLHSALDQLTCKLAILNKRGVSGVYFPFGKDADDFVSVAVQEKIDKLSTDARSMIQGFKPYHGGNEYLWLIHPLHLIDKHRRILATGHLGQLTGLSNQKVSGSLTVGMTVDFGKQEWQSFDEGVELYRVGATAKVDTGHHTVAINIAFGEPEEALGKPVVDALMRMADSTRLVLSECGKRFFL